MLPFNEDEVVESYRKIGYTPLRGKWHDGDTKRCCPITAVVMANIGIDATKGCFGSWATARAMAVKLGEINNTQVTPNHVRAFVTGFDATNPFPYSDQLQMEIMQQGIQVRNRLIAEGLLSVPGASECDANVIRCKPQLM